MWNLKKNKNLQKIIGGHTIRNGKVFQAHSKNRKGKCELATQGNHHYVPRRSLTPVHSEVAKHRNHKKYFTNSTVKVNSSFT